MEASTSGERAHGGDAYANAEILARHSWSPLPCVGDWVQCIAGTGCPVWQVSQEDLEADWIECSDFALVRRPSSFITEGSVHGH